MQVSVDGRAAQANISDLRRASVFVISAARPASQALVTLEAIAGGKLRGVVRSASCSSSSAAASGAARECFYIPAACEGLVVIPVAFGFHGGHTCEPSRQRGDDRAVRPEGQLLFARGLRAQAEGEGQDWQGPLSCPSAQSLGGGGSSFISRFPEFDKSLPARKGMHACMQISRTSGTTLV